MFVCVKKKIYIYEFNNITTNDSGFIYAGGTIDEITTLKHVNVILYQENLSKKLCNCKILYKLRHYAPYTVLKSVFISMPTHIYNKR